MIYLSCSLLFIFKQLPDYFLRNDHNPRLATIALCQWGNCQYYFGLCLYLSKFGWGMAGAAIATVMSPLTSLILITLHKWSPQRVLRLKSLK